MTKRIFWHIFIVAVIVLTASVAMIVGALYEYYSNQYIIQLKNEAVYISQGMAADDGYLKNLGNKTDNTRITLINPDGVVLYDNTADVSKMENHSNREEFTEALTSGQGESIRYSKTLSEDTLYYAAKLKDGTVLRVSSTKHSVLALIYGMLRYILLILLSAIALSAFLAYRVSKRVVRPLNDLDFEHPEEAVTYEELSPMLLRISKQNKQIHAQMAELERKQHEFNTIIENMKEGLLIVDKKTDILSYNTSALKLLGANSVTENQSALTLNRSESFRKAIELSLSGRHNEQTMLYGGRTYQLMSNPVYENGYVVGAIIIIMDVSEKEEREKLRREFTANVSHELKTPLTSISGYAEIIRNGIAKPCDIGQFAASIYEESQRLIMLIEDIIKLSQLDENTTFFEKQEIELSGIAKLVCDRLKAEAEKKKVGIEFDLQTASVLGVYKILDEMIYNLVDNAIKYNKDGGKVRIKIEKNNIGAKLTVEDTGIGIAADEIDRVFERFYRIDKSHSKEVKGTGLGLSIVKHGAIYHDAKISLSSKPGEGTKVSIQFKQV